MMRVRYLLCSVQNFTDGGEDLGSRVGERAGHTDASGASVAATVEELGELGAVYGVVLGTEGDANFFVWEFFEEGGDDDALDGSDVVDHVLGVLGFEAEGVFDGHGEVPVGDRAVVFQFEGVEQGAEEFDFAVGLVIVGEGVDGADVNTAPDEVCGHFVGSGGGIGVLE